MSVPKRMFSYIIRDITLHIRPEHVKPKFGCIAVTVNCNLRCRMCTFWRQKSPDPSLEEIKHWIRELAELGMEYVDIGGGEPFLRKDLTEIVNEIHAYGMTCSVTTNGWLVGKVPLPPADDFFVSIDGAKPETHDKIRGVKGSWERVVNAVKIIKKQGLRINRVNFVLQKTNYHELKDFCLFARSLGLSVTIVPVSSKLAGQPSNPESLDGVDLNRLKTSIAKALKVGNVTNGPEFFDSVLHKLSLKYENYPQPCLTPFERIIIFPDGNVYPCCNFDRPVGNIKNKSLREIYDDYKDLRRNVMLGKYPHCSKCMVPDIYFRKSLSSLMKSYLVRPLGRIKEKI